MVMAKIRLSRGWQARTLRWMCVLGALTLVGCALPRRDAPPTRFSSATPVDFPADVRFLSTDRVSVESQSTAALQRLRSRSKDGRVRALVLSGGGAGGAFGAGALVGLTRRQERPQFDVVTGVSAGALIAPFAFLGPEWDAHALAPVAELPVLEVVAATHIRADLTLGLGKVVHDYLQRSSTLKGYEVSTELRHAS
jgi:hypothetical protein